MKTTAGILKLCCTIVLVFLVIAAALLVFVEGALLMAGSFSSLAQSNGPITINGGTMTPAEMDALKPVVLVALCLGLVGLLITIVGVIKTRTAYGECKEERPFSEKCVKALKTSARTEIIGGIFGIIASCVLTFMASNLTVNGSPLGSTTTTLSLTFLFYALQKYLFFHVTEYGHSLENHQDRL